MIKINKTLLYCDNEVLSDEDLNPSDKNNIYEFVKNNNEYEWKLKIKKSKCSFCNEENWYTSDEIFYEFNICKNFDNNFDIMKNKFHFIYQDYKTKCCDNCFLKKYNPSDFKNIYYLNIYNKELVWFVKYQQTKCNICCIEYHIDIGNIYYRNCINKKKLNNQNYLKIFMLWENGTFECKKCFENKNTLNNYTYKSKLIYQKVNNHLYFENIIMETRYQCEVCNEDCIEISKYDKNICKKCIAIQNSK